MSNGMKEVTASVQEQPKESRKGENKTARTHRVGAFTAGICMVVFGVLFLVSMFYETLNYRLIFSLWPIILIFLGLELLLSNFVKGQIKYDKAAIFLMVMMTFFAMGMAAADMCMEMAEIYMLKQI